MKNTFLKFLKNEQFALNSGLFVYEKSGDSPKVQPVMASIIEKSADMTKEWTRMGRDLENELNKDTDRKNALEYEIYQKLSKSDLSKVDVESLTGFLNKFPKFKSYVAQNETTPTKLLELLALDVKNRDVMNSFAFNSNSTPMIMTKVADYAMGLEGISGFGGPFLDHLINHRNTPPESLAKLADKFPFAVSVSTRTPQKTLAKLAEQYFDASSTGDNDFNGIGIREHVAGNTNTPSEVLAKLAEHKDNGTREIVASNESTPTIVLAKLATDKIVDVRCWVGLNKSTPIPILEKLATDRAKTGEGNRNSPAEYVARNTKTPPELLKKLAADKDENISYSAKHNPSLPKS